MKKFHILLVEDNPADADLTIEILAATNDVEVSLAKDGIEALTLLENVSNSSQTGRPTLILLDLNLPRKDGRQVLAVLKTHDLLRRIPVVVLSSSGPILISPTATSLARIATLPSRWTCKLSGSIVGAVQGFWLGSAKLPHREGHSTATRVGACL